MRNPQPACRIAYRNCALFQSFSRNLNNAWFIPSLDFYLIIYALHTGYSPHDKG